MAYKAWNATNFMDKDIISSAEMIKHSEKHGTLGMGRCATFVVAANDSEAISKQQADYVCDGTDDQVTIQTAIDAAYAAAKGEVLQMPGTYNITGALVGKDYVDIRGVGYGTIWDVSGLGSADVITMGNDSALRNMKITGVVSPFPAAGSQQIVSGNRNLFSRIWCENVGGGIEIGSKSDVSISDIRMVNIRNAGDAAAGVHVNNSSNVYVDKFFVKGSNRGIEVEDGAKNVFVSKGYLEDIQNYNSVGVVAFAIDAHSHDSGGGVDNITFSEIYMKNTIGISCQHSGAGFATADLPKNVRFDNITIVDPFYVSIVGGIDVSVRNSKIYTWNPATDYEMVIQQAAKHVVIENVVFPDFKGYGGISSHSTASDAVVSKCSFTPDSVAAGNYAINFEADNGRIIDNVINGSPATQAMSVHGAYNTISHNIIENKNIWLRSGSTYADVFGNVLKNGVVVDDGTGNNVYRNRGFITEKSGTATLVSGTTSIAVSHGLAVTPVAGDIVVTPIEAWGNMTQFYIDTYTSTQFTIHANINPGLDVDFAWKAIIL